ncbi:MAG TPA: molybdopterin biosynthesis protein [Candidatus Limnocylindrales bacterium]|nr:molybdopterin biosynthesis protein [Candidatus Limnocylindrales bacterium]
MRKVYLSNIPRRRALDKFMTGVAITRRTEAEAVTDALGRITAEPIFARLSMPGYHAAAMDGIAVCAENTFGASDQNPLRLDPAISYRNINTGDPMPTGFDAVIKVEEIQFLAENQVEILAPATPWQHVRAVGEDVVAGELIVPALHCLKPPDLGALLAGGVTTIQLLARPKVRIIPSGSEVVDPGSARKPGSIPDFNSTVIASYLKEWGAEPLIDPIVPDDLIKIKAAISKALQDSDLIIVIAGSSAGEKDYTFTAIEELGEVFLHGVATRPGKPTILGQVEAKPVIGLPGYPVSAYLSLEWFVRPMIFRYLGLPVPERDKLKVTLGRRVVSEIGVEEHVRMTVGYVNDRFIANPLTRGAGVTMSLVRADGLLIIPERTLGFEQNETVEIELYRPKTELRHNLLVSGSHDLIIDLLATALKEHDPYLTLSSSHLGSMGGIAAVGKGQAHLAGVHLFDPETGEYNIPYIKRLLPDLALHLINLAYRTQGWMVPPGNPDGLKTIEQLAESKLAFVNRQKGAGTRILFDHLLRNANISPTLIYGYEREEHTHLNVAAAIAAGTARVGLGILPAARAFGLDFIPVIEERYDLLMSDSFYNSRAAELLLKVIANPTFQKQVEAMGGYSLRNSGSRIEGV